MKKSIMGWVLLGLAGLAVMLLVVSFRVMRSQSSTNSTVASSHSTPEAGSLPGSMYNPSLVIEGEGRLERAVRAEITHLSKNQPGLGQVNLITTLEGAGESPVMAVTIQQPSGFWTPFYSRSTLEVAAAYASNGDLSFRNTVPTRFKGTGNLPVMQYEGRYTITDVSWGLMSLPGYQQYLAHQIAVAVLGSLKDQLKG